MIYSKTVDNATNSLREKALLYEIVLNVFTTSEEHKIQCLKCVLDTM